MFKIKNSKATSELSTTLNRLLICLKESPPPVETRPFLVNIIQCYETWKICIWIRPCFNTCCRKYLNQIVDKWVLILNFNSEGETKTDLASNFHIHLSNFLTIYTVHMCRTCQKTNFFLTTKISCSLFKGIRHRLVTKTAAQFMKDQYQGTVRKKLQTV